MTVEGIRGSSDRSVLVLTSLAGGPKHGYGLIKDIEGFAGVKLGPGTLYGCLAKLEQAGLVKALPAGPSPSLSHHRIRSASGEGKAHRVRAHRRTRVGQSCRSHVMNSWLFRSLVVLYPKAWRERYSKEVGDLSAELLEAGETTRLHLALELARSVLTERVRSLHRGRFMVVLSGSAALVVVVVAAFLATNGFGLGGATSPGMTPTGWVPVAYPRRRYRFRRQLYSSVQRRPESVP